MSNATPSRAGHIGVKPSVRNSKPIVPRNWSQKLDPPYKVLKGSMRPKFPELVQNKGMDSVNDAGKARLNDSSVCLLQAQSS